MKIILKNGEGYLYQRLDLLLGGKRISEIVLSNGSEVEMEVELDDKIPFMRAYRYSEEDNGVSAFISLYYKGKEYLIDSVDYFSHKDFEKYLQFTKTMDFYVNCEDVQNEIQKIVNSLIEQNIINESLDDILDKEKALSKNKNNNVVELNTER